MGLPIIEPYGSDVFTHRLVELIGQSRYDFWFSQRAEFAARGEVLEIRVPNRHFVEWLSSRYRAVMDQIAKELLGVNAQVEFVIGGEQFRQLRTEQLAAKPECLVENPEQLILSKSSSAHPEVPDLRSERQSTSIPCRRFGDFIVSSDNRLAFYSTEDLARGEESGVSLLVLVGSPSRGKSHLLHALKAEYQQKSSRRAKLIDAEEFIGRYLAALRTGRTASFRRTILDCDLLLIDDLDRLAGKVSCQAEFLALIETARQKGIRLVAAMGQHPRQLVGLSPAVAERLQAGLVCTVGALDATGRSNLLRKSLIRLGPGLVAEGIFENVGHSLPESAREIEGIAQKIWLLARMESRPVDQIVLDRVLNEHAPPPNSKSLEDVASTVAGVLGVGIEALRGRSKAKILIHGRLLAYYFLRRLGLGSAGEIGAYFGGRSHSTIIHGEKQVRARLDHAQELPDDWPKGWKGMLERIEQMLGR